MNDRYINMSIFVEQHHDDIFIKLLDVNSLITLSIVNKRYYKLTQKLLLPFRRFYNYHTKLQIKLKENIYDRASKCENIVTNASDKNDIMMIIKACIFANIDVFKYVFKKYNINIYDEHHRILSRDLWMMLFEICIYKLNTNGIIIAKYLWSRFRINISLMCDYFIDVCAYKNNIKFAAWLISINNEHISYRGVLTACYFNNTEFVKFALNKTIYVEHELAKMHRIAIKYSYNKLSKILINYL